MFSLFAKTYTVWLVSYPDFQLEGKIINRKHYPGIELGWKTYRHAHYHGLQIKLSTNIHWPQFYRGIYFFYFGLWIFASFLNCHFILSSLLLLLESCSSSERGKIFCSKERIARHIPLLCSLWNYIVSQQEWKQFH